MTHGTGTGFSRRALVLAAGLLSLAACNTSADQNEPADGVFVARAGDVMIAIVAADDLVTAYACDGHDPDLVPLDVWFHGRLDGGSGTLTADDGTTIDLTIAGDRLDGALEPVDEGDILDFGGAKVKDDVAGLYWGKQGDWLGGWIIDDAGDQRGAVLKRNTGDVTFSAIQPAQTMVTLPDQSVMTVARMATPKNYK